MRVLVLVLHVALGLGELGKGESCWMVDLSL